MLRNEAAGERQAGSIGFKLYIIVEAFVKNRWIVHVRAVALIIIGGLLLPGLSPAGEGWWNDGWQYRKKIAFNTTETGADIKENLSEVPVLVRLHSGNFDFTSAREDGGDIRFVAADDATLLKHHIEKIDTLDEIALVWVRVPRIAGATDQGYMNMYYGNENALGGQDSGGTFDMAQVAAYHLGEVEGMPRDATANDNHAAFFSGGQGLPGVIGNGVSLNGAGDRLTVAATPALDFSSGFTLSAWIRINMAQADAMIFSRQGDGGSLVVGIDDTKIYAAIGSGDGDPIATDRSADLPVGSWHLVTVTGSPGSRLAIYLDGMEMTWGNLPATLPALTGDLVVGDDGQGGRSFIGDLDEIGIFTQALSRDRIRAAFATQGPDGLFLTFGEELMGGGGSMPVFYLGTILKNVTLDGLVVIGLLVILSAVSWFAFLGKAAFLFMAKRDNRKFLSTFESKADPTAMEIDNGDEYSSSNLYRVYRAGCRVIHNGSAAEETVDRKTPRVTSKTLKTFKTELDKWYVNETKRLNGNLTVLTMAITGGPFLGLLGTIWGVMNTFAAMAEAGEANIMAIAPGVASALATTVVGLLVAIPALFGYNFLTSQIKNITADLTVFIDEFALKVENGE
ncbi:transporter ExbB [Desulfosarcina alkanivorans]|uniref:Transporter ExbB n=1 Tax=Desulfosarcina alkanivorans TaxID=571177 RepID=A0A5K7YJN1_9BACT|nr:transporter ExbB [Desulfosarcina alkanivorans]